MTTALQPAAILKLIIPMGLVGLALWFRSALISVEGDWQAVIRHTPYVLCLVAAAGSILFDRLRILACSTGITIFYWILQTQLQTSLTADRDAARTYLVVATVIPIFILSLVMLPERGILTRHGILGCIFIIITTGLSYAFATAGIGIFDQFLPYFTLKPVEWHILSLGSAGIMAVCFLVGIIILMLRNSHTEASMLAVLVACYVTLALFHLTGISAVMGSAASLCILWALLRNSHTMAYRDDLTGIPGRRALNERLNKLAGKYSIAMLDIDHFKSFNDKYGHDVGDQVLRMIASRIARVGGGGAAYRYGGEEFCIVFPRREPEAAAQAIDVVRDNIEAYQMTIRDNSKRKHLKKGVKHRGATPIGRRKTVSVTVSAGVAARDDKALDPEAVIKAADQRLYKAKNAGRNQVVWR